jgi:hypothetical protein
VFVTVTGPDVAPAGTIARSRVDDTWVTVVAARPLNFTTELALNPTPLIVTAVPCGPLVGPIAVIENVTVNGVIVAVPEGVDTVIVPVAAPFGTVTFSWVPDFAVIGIVFVPSVT